MYQLCQRTVDSLYPERIILAHDDGNSSNSTAVSDAEGTVYTALFLCQFILTNFSLIFGFCKKFPLLGKAPFMTKFVKFQNKPNSQRITIIKITVCSSRLTYSYTSYVGCEVTL